MKILKIKPIVMSGLLVVAVVLFGFNAPNAQRAENKDYSANLASWKSGSNDEKYDFRFDVVKRKDGKKFSLFTGNRASKDISHMLIGGDYLVALGMGPSAPDYYSNCYFFDLANSKLLLNQNPVLDYMIRPAVSPDGQMVLFDKFRPLHFRDDNTDTSEIHLMRATDQGINVTAVYPKTFSLFPKFDDVDDEAKAGRFLLMSSILWLSDGMRAAFLIEGQGVEEGKYRLIVLRIGASGYDYASKDILNDGETFPRGDTLKWSQKDQSVECLLGPADPSSNRKSLVVDLPTSFLPVPRAN